MGTARRGHATTKRNSTTTDGFRVFQGRTVAEEFQELRQLGGVPANHVPEHTRQHQAAY